MNRIVSLSLIILSFVVWSCAGTNQSGTTAEAETTPDSDATAATTPEPEAPAAGSELFSVVTLVDTIPSPRKEMTTMVGDAKVTVNYGSPSVKGRTLWGDLVPYDKVWRTGANEATVFETSADLSISGQTLPAGRYSMFTIPGESDWTIIFNETADQWGHYQYDEGKDVMRVKAVPTMVEANAETLEFMVPEAGTISMAWGGLVLPLTLAGA